MPKQVYLTDGLLDALLDLAARRDPGSLSAALSTTSAGELQFEATETQPRGMTADTSVFTDMYVPPDTQAVDAVFGVEVTVPHGQTRGRFISHPTGRLEVSARDDLNEVVLIAVPPWTPEDVAAFNRAGEHLPMQTLAAVPPTPEW